MEMSPTNSDVKKTKKKKMVPHSQLIEELCHWYDVDLNLLVYNKYVKNGKLTESGLDLYAKSREKVEENK